MKPINDYHVPIRDPRSQTIFTKAVKVSTSSPYQTKVEENRELFRMAVERRRAEFLADLREFYRTYSAKEYLKGMPS